MLKLAPLGADNSLIPEASTRIHLSAATRQAQPLHVCKRCDSKLVQCSDWAEAGDDRWQLRLECPNCGWSRCGTFSSFQLTCLEDQVDAGFDVLLRDLKRLTTANMTEEIERLACALDSGLILPEDF